MREGDTGETKQNVWLETLNSSEYLRSCFQHKREQRLTEVQAEVKVK